MRKVTFYVEIASDGCIPKNTWERLKAYIALSKDHEVYFVWMYGELKISHSSISSILRFEKRECVHKGLIVRNIAISNQKNISLLAIYLMKKYNFVYKKDIAADRKADIARMCFGNAPISCSYSSCLGTGITLLSNGTIKACPFINNNIALDDRLDVQSLQEVFNTDSFLELLKANIERRNKCKASCQYFALCKGGCALEEVHEDCKIYSEIKKKKKVLSESDMNNHEYREQRIIEASNMYKV